ncbi:hypothetical protein OG716_40940 [Nocardia sp. NBC_01388]
MFASEIRLDTPGGEVNAAADAFGSKCSDESSLSQRVKLFEMFSAAALHSAGRV